jgi:phosphoribosylformylglycinamidine cyclo-ligase
MAAHPSYYAAMQPILAQVKAIAHITGGGMPGNVPRVLPEDVSVQLDWGGWPVPPIFSLLQELGGVDPDEMLRVFNMGLGLIFIASATYDPRERCPRAIAVGRVIARRDTRVIFAR